MADNLGALGEVARLINTKQIAEADKALSAIEADPTHPAWDKPLVMVVLRDRIDKGASVWTSNRSATP